MKGNGFRILYLVALPFAVCMGNAAVMAAAENITSAQDVEALQAAAQAGDGDAQFNLGTIYQKGDVVQQDDIKAVYWFHKAADQGDPDAQFALGFAYRGGFGVPMDRVLSYMWFDIAARNGDDSAASLRSAVAELMTFPQIAEAKSLSRRWHPGIGDALLRDYITRSQPQ